MYIYIYMCVCARVCVSACVVVCVCVRRRFFSGIVESHSALLNNSMASLAFRTPKRRQGADALRRALKPLATLRLSTTHPLVQGSSKDLHFATI